MDTRSGSLYPGQGKGAGNLRQCWNGEGCILVPALPSLLRDSGQVQPCPLLRGLRKDLMREPGGRGVKSLCLVPYPTPCSIPGSLEMALLWRGVTTPEPPLDGTVPGRLRRTREAPHLDRRVIGEPKSPHDLPQATLQHQVYRESLGLLGSPPPPPPLPFCSLLQFPLRLFPPALSALSHFLSLLVSLGLCISP